MDISKVLRNLSKRKKIIIGVVILLILASQCVMISFYSATDVPRDFSLIEKVTVKSRVVEGGEYAELMNLTGAEEIEEFMSIISKGRYTVDLFTDSQTYTGVEDIYISIYTEDKGYTVYLDKKMRMTTKCYDDDNKQNNFKHYYSLGNKEWYSDILQLKAEVSE